MLISKGAPSPSPHQDRGELGTLLGGRNETEHSRPQWLYVNRGPRISDTGDVGTKQKPAIMSCSTARPTQAERHNIVKRVRDKLANNLRSDLVVNKAADTHVIDVTIVFE